MKFDDQRDEGRPSVFAALLPVVAAALGDFEVLTVPEQLSVAEAVAPGRRVNIVADRVALANWIKTAERPFVLVSPWGKHSGEQEFWQDVRAVGASFAVLVPATDLRRRVPMQTGHLGTPKLVIEARLDAHDVNAAFQAALIVIEPEEAGSTTVTKFFHVPHEEDVDLSELITDLRRLLTQEGGSTTFGFVYRGQSLVGKSLRVVDHDPRLQAQEADLAVFGEGATVGDVFQVLRASKPELTEDINRGTTQSIRVINGRDVTVFGELLPAEEEPSERTRSLAVRNLALQPGDLVMRAIERPLHPCAPTEISASDLPLSAGPSLLVLRAKVPLGRTEFDFYKRYLGSLRSREVMRPSRMGSALQLSEIHRTLLPRPDADLLDALHEIYSARDALRGWAAEGVRITEVAFTGSAREARTKLIETGRLLRQRVEAAEQIGSLDHRIANFYPYPIAYKWRLARTAEETGDDASTYAALLDCFEAILAYSASIALSFAHVNGVPVPAMAQVRQKLSATAHGTSLGDWASILKQVASSKVFTNLPLEAALGSVRQLLPEASVAARAQERLSGRRNDESHQRRVDRLELPDAIRNARADLEVLLSQAGFLADMPLLQIKSTEWDSIERRGQSVAQALRGDHPVGAMLRFEHDDPGLEIDSLYVQDLTGEPVLMRPFLVREECPKCHTWSTFHPDRRDRGTLVFKALDHSHTIDGTLHLPALRTVGYLEK